MIEVVNRILIKPFANWNIFSMKYSVTGCECTGPPINSYCCYEQGSSVCCDIKDSYSPGGRKGMCQREYIIYRVIFKHISLLVTSKSFDWLLRAWILFGKRSHGLHGGWIGDHRIGLYVRSSCAQKGLHEGFKRPILRSSCRVLLQGDVGWFSFQWDTWPLRNKHIAVQHERCMR